MTAGYQTHRFEAQLDTGFSEDIIVPASTPSSGPPVLVSPVWLADDRVLQLATYVGIARIGTFPPVHVTVISLGSRFLIGQKLLARFVVTLDRGRRVVVCL